MKAIFPGYPKNPTTPMTFRLPLKIAQKAHHFMPDSPQKKARYLCFPSFSLSFPAFATIFCWSVLSSVATFAASPGAPTNLRILENYDQLGVDAANPSFAWFLNDSDRGEKQTAFQIIVATSQGDLNNNNGNQWNSGMVSNNSAQYLVKYIGSPLQSNTKYWWKVMNWDKDGNPSPWSASATFITGFIDPSKWTAGWITKSDDTTTVPSLFRTEFTVNKNVLQATAQICGLGQFELYLNGSKVGNHEYDPGWTNYKKSCLYVTFDLTNSIRNGSNALGVILADGFYNNNNAKGRYSKFTGSFGPKIMIFELNIQFTDGTSTKVISDTSWKTSTGPVTYSYVYGGEDYDARLEKAGWSQAGFNAADWTAAVEAKVPEGKLTSQKQPPLTIMQTYDQVNVKQPVAGTSVYDLGKNFSGFMEITVNGSAGQTVHLAPSENLASNGDIDQHSIGRFQWCVYTLKGNGTEVWRPKFYYSGFRYVQIQTTGAQVSHVRGYNMHSSAKQVGSFSTSNGTYNAVHSMILQSMKSNLQSLFTDCPHREKLGWLEQSYLLAPSVAFNFDVQALWTKITSDTTEAQLPNGMVPNISPEYTIFSGKFRDSCTWGSAAVMDPWYLYQLYGDKDALARQYATMKNYVQYLQGRASGNLLTYGGLGDWGGIEAWNTALVESASYYQDIITLRDTATILGHTADTNEFDSLALQVKTAFNGSGFFDVANRHYTPVTQTHQAMPLYLGLVPLGDEPNVLRVLLDDISSHGNHLQTGEIGHRYMLQTLARYGFNELVDKMIMNPTQPSFAFFVSLGKTSLPEFWDGSNSQEHAMMGHVEEWFYNSVAGIQQTQPGYAQFRIKPAVISSLSSVTASVETVRGVVASSWTNNGTQYTHSVTVPVNSTALIYVPKFASPRSIIKEGGIVIWQNNSAHGNVPGISFNSTSGDYTVWDVGSGSYNFTVTGNGGTTPALTSATNTVGARPPSSNSIMSE